MLKILGIFISWEATKTVLGRSYGVATSNISNILLNKNWKIL